MMDLVRELVEPSRRALLSELKSGPKTVGDLVDATGLKQPNVSNHLSRLKSKGVLKSSKVGRQVYYSFSDPDIAKAALSLISPIVTEQRSVEFGEETTRVFSRAACQGDEAACTEIVDALLRTDQGMVMIYSKLFAESMQMIGQWWLVKAIDEGQEHLASAIIERLMARVLHFAAPARPGANKVVLGCSQGNWHSIGIRMISDVMRLAGWRTYYLGANVPHAPFLAAVKEHKPQAVMVSCPIEDGVPDALELVKQLNDLRGKEDWVIGVGGGSLVRNEVLAKEAGADFSCTNLLQFTEEILPSISGSGRSALA
jgi:methanogenic corrinoid protein MtbC1